MHPSVIMVTGCAGFIGSNFVKKFQSVFPETRILGIDNFSTGRRDAVHPAVTFVEGSIADAALMQSLMQKHKPEYVFHFAAIPKVSYCTEHPFETGQINTGGTIALLEASRDAGVKRFIYSSSAAIYGNTEQVPTTEDSPAQPLSPYGFQKYSGEVYCKLFSSLYGLDTGSLRYFNAFGPGQYPESGYATVVAAWLGALHAPGGKKPFLEGDGSQTRDFCYIDNIIHANMCALQVPEKLNGEAFNVGTGSAVSLMTIKELIEESTGSTIDLELRPARLGDIKDSCADISKSTRVLGYTPQVTLKAGLAETVGWAHQAYTQGSVFLVTALIVALAGVSLAVWSQYAVPEPTTASVTVSPQVPSESASSAQLGNSRIILEYARTEAERTRGLSGRLELPTGHGLLFAFPYDYAWGIWMKDMRFAIDIVWLDQEFRVVHSEENVPPESYPRVYVPPALSRYVLELPAGTIKTAQFGVGSSLVFTTETN